MKSEKFYNIQFSAKAFFNLLLDKEQYVRFMELTKGKETVGGNEECFESVKGIFKGEFEKEAHNRGGEVEFDYLDYTDTDFEDINITELDVFLQPIKNKD